MDFQPKTNTKREVFNAWLVPWHSQYTLVIKGIARAFWDTYSRIMVLLRPHKNAVWILPSGIFHASAFDMHEMKQEAQLSPI